MQRSKPTSTSKQTECRLPARAAGFFVFFRLRARFCGAPRPPRRAGEREISGTFGENRGKTGNFFGFVANPRRILYTVSKKQPSRRREGKGEGNEKENGCRLCAGGGAELCASGRVRHGYEQPFGGRDEEFRHGAVRAGGLYGHGHRSARRRQRFAHGCGYGVRTVQRGTRRDHGFFADGFHAGCGGAVCIVRRTVGQHGLYRVRQGRAGRLADGRVGRIGPRLFDEQRHGHLPERGCPVRRRRRRGAYGRHYGAHAVCAVRAGDAARRRLLCRVCRRRAKRL